MDTELPNIQFDYKKIWLAAKSNVRDLFTKPDFYIERYFLIIGLVAGLLFVALIPPLQGADEPNHYLRAYQISTGDFVSERVRGSVGGIFPDLVRFKGVNIGGKLPAGIVRFAQADYNLHQMSDVKMTAAQLRYDANLQTSKSSRKAAFPNTAAYSPVAYAPQTVAMFIGRHLGATPLALMYLARIAGLFTALGLITLAIRLMPFGKLPMAVMALLPMTVSQLSVISADTLAIGTSFLAISLTLHFAWRKKNLSVVDIGLLIGIYGLLGLNKQALIPLTLINFILLVNPLIRRSRALVTVVGTVALAFITSSLWNHYVRGMVIFGYHQTYTAANYHAQMHWLVRHPLQYLHVLYNSFLTENFTWVRTSFIGDLGWLDTPLPPLVNSLGYVFIGVVVFIASQGEKIRIPRWAKSLMFLSSALIILAICTLFYLLCEIPRSPILVELQGRYLIVPVTLMLVALSGTGNSFFSPVRYQQLAKRCLRFSGVLLVVMTYVVIVRYYNIGPFLKALAFIHV